MFNLSDTTKKMLTALLCLCVIAGILGVLAIVFLYKSENTFIFSVKYVFGLAAGYIFSCFKMLLLEKSIKKSVDMEKNDASAYARGQYILRYFLSFAVLVVLALISPVCLLGAAIGMVLVQPAAAFAGRWIESR